jgi:hypothetical protein
LQKEASFSRRVGGKSLQLAAQVLWLKEFPPRGLAYAIARCHGPEDLLGPPLKAVLFFGGEIAGGQGDRIDIPNQALPDDVPWPAKRS